LRAVDNGEYVDKMWIGEDEGSRTPGDTVERLLHLARELIALRCDVIFATSPNAIRAATNATATIRIVGIDLESDPVVSGWAKEPRPPWRNKNERRREGPLLALLAAALLLALVVGLVSSLAARIGWLA